MDPSSQRDFTAFYDATWPRTVACAYAMTGILSDAEDLAMQWPYRTNATHTAGQSNPA